MRLGRRFQLWRYGVGHGQLLLRAVADDAMATRVDLGFKGVEYIQLSTAMTIERVVEGHWEGLPAEVASLVQAGRVRVFLLEGPSPGCVVAAAAFSHEGAGAYWEPSELFPDW